MLKHVNFVQRLKFSNMTIVKNLVHSTLWLIFNTVLEIMQNWFSLLFAVTISGLLEAYTAQLDNAFIPLVFYSLLCL